VCDKIKKKEKGRRHRMLHITKDNFKEEVETCDKLVVIDLYADWCGPCKMLAPTLEALSEKREDIKICKINVDDEPELAGTFDVSVIPTLVAMKDGGVLGKTQGVVTEDAILSLMGLK
jgi:thioredoxin 1